MDKKKVIERRNPKRISSQRDFYQKLAVVGIIVLIVLGIFFLAGLKGVGKASYTPSDKEVYIEGNSKKAVDDSDYCGPDSGDDECKDNCGDSTKWCYSTLKDLCYPTNSIIKGEGSANWVQNDDLSYSYGFGYTTDDKIAALCDPAGEGSFPPGYAWVFCTGSIKKTVYKEKFYCSNGGQWFPCTGEKDPTGKLINDEIIKDEKHLCVASSKKWMTCDEKLDKKDWLKLDGLFLCRGSYWDKCDSDSKGVSTTKVYYCSKDSGKWKWKECANTKLSADLTQLCQQEGTTWKWKNCTKDGLTIGSYYCKTKGGVWAELGAGDVVASGKLDSCNVTDTGIHSGNSSKYCNGINWTDCTTANKFTLSTDGKAYCGNCSSTCKWSTCNSSLNKERYPAGDKAPNQYQFLCDDTQQKWLTCDASTTPNLLFSSGSSKDQFYCSYKGDHFQWQKCNSTKTTPDLISGDNTKICKKVSNKEQWVSSTKVGPDPDLPQFYGLSALGWWVCNSTNKGFIFNLSSSSLYHQCNGTAWKEEKCDSKGKHLYNASNTKQTLYMCYDNIWQPVNYTSETKTLSPSDDFEVIITKDIMLSDLNGVKDLTLCDNGTESTNNKATYCYASYSDKSVNKKKSAKTGKAMDAGVQLDNIIYPTPQGPDVQTKLLIPLENLPTFDFGKTLPQYAFLSNLANLSGSITLTFQKVFSLEHLKGPGTPPLLATIKGQQVAFLYEKETSVSKDKKVSIIMVSDVTASKGQTFKSDVFTTNLNNGQRVVLKKDSYYYLLGLKSPGAGFDIENLYLKRLPSLEEYPMEVKVPDNTVYFKAKGNDFTVSFSGVGFIEITPTEAKTQPVGTGEPYSLLKEYEVPITKNQPIELTAPKIPNVKKIYFCDEVSSSEKANICFDKESNKHEIYSLNYLYGASSTIYANSGVAFLYETVTSSSEAKQVKAILIQDITSKEAVLESDTFAENMKNGRRLVLKLGNLYYLLSHPNVGAGDYSPKLLTLHYLPSLINYSNSGYVTLASKGVQGVQFAPYGGTTITIYPEGNYYKISSKLSKEVATTGGFPEDISYTYEVSFDKEKPVTLLNINGQEPTIKVCSDDLKSDKTKMQVCISGAGAPVKVTLFHDTPLMINVSNTSLVFLYQTVLYQADNTTINKKQGHIFLVKDLSQTPSEQDYNNLIINLAEGGRRFALNFGGKFYLLSHTFPSPTGFFEMTELKLTLYQDGNEIEIPAVGTEKKVSFSLPDGGRITLNGGEMEQFVIPGPYKILTYANLPTLGLPIDLKDNLHAVFSSIKPVTITLPEMGLVQASELDPKEDKSTFKVKLNLENMDLSSDLLGENKLPSDFTLSYQKPLIMTKGEDKVLLYYNKFNYVDKQPIKYVDIYYMQPKDEFIETAADALKGEIEEVVIPTPPFQIWAQTKQQIADIPINLKETLYTTFSSEGPVNVVQPKLGLVQVSETVDQKKVQALFKIQFTGTSQKYQLPYQKPFVAKEVPNLLFYYDQAYFVGAVPVKSAKIYYLYDITKDPFYHDFNNQFVETLTAGNELALKFKDSYYLLGYKGASQENTTFFEENKLQLKALNNSALYENPESTDEGLLFKVPEGNIFVKIDYANNKIIFSTKTTEALSLEEFSEEKYTHILTTANKVVINQTTVSMCSLKLYADIPSSAGICFNSSNNATPVTDYKTFIIEGKPYLLEVGDQTGAEKEVVIHQVLPLNITPWTVNWEQFSQKLIDGDTPVFDIGGTLYLPSTPDNQLKSLFFKEVGDANAEWSYAENLQEIGKTAILFNGTFVLKDRLLFADQTMKGEERDLTLTLRDYYIVPYTGVMELNKTNYINVPFVTKIDGKKYSMYVYFNELNLIKASLYSFNLQQKLIDKYYALGDYKYLTLDGESIKVDITTKETVPGDKKSKIPVVFISRP